jgi:hypothetical protein
MIYDYQTDHIRWRISEDRYEQGHLERFIRGDNPPFGGWLVYVGEYSSCLAAEQAADEKEWEEFPLEEPEIEPIPLVPNLPAPPLRKVA